MKEIKLETKRLIFLRKFEMEDVEECYNNWANDANVGRFLPMYPVHNQLSMKEMINGFLNAYRLDAKIWVIEEKKTSNLIGTVNVNVPYWDLKIGEIAYLIGSRWWSKGYAVEACQAVLHYMFECEKTIYGGSKM